MTPDNDPSVAELVERLAGVDVTCDNDWDKESLRLTIAALTRLERRCAEQKPCVLPCVKCGSDKIGRVWLPAGQPIPLQYGSYAGEEIIWHHCQVCGYGWSSGILDATKGKP